MNRITDQNIQYYLDILNYGKEIVGTFVIGGDNGQTTIIQYDNANYGSEEVWRGTKRECYAFVHGMIEGRKNA